MRLLFTLPDFWPHVRRGSETIVHGLGREMARRGHSVRVVTRRPGLMPRVTRVGDLTVEYVPTPRYRTDFAGLDGFARVACVAGLWHRADLLHAFYLSDARGLLRAARWRRRPLVFSMHGSPDREWWQRHHPRTHEGMLQVLSEASAVTVLSRDSALRMQADYGLTPRILPPGIDCAEWAQPRRTPEAPTLVCATTLDDGRKRLDVLIDAFAIVATRLPDLRLLLVGGGDAANVQRRVAALDAGVATRVELLAPTEFLPALYRRCTIGALSSESEAFGMSVLEYLAAGMPAVVTEEGGMPEIVTETTGTRFRSGHVEACADAIERALQLASDPGTQARCRTRAADFDWSVRGDDHEALYAELTGAIAGGRRA